MNYKTINDNPAFKAGKEHGKFIAKQIMPHTVKKRDFDINENQKQLRSEYENYSNRKNHN